MSYKHSVRSLKSVWDGCRYSKCVRAQERMKDWSSPYYRLKKFASIANVIWLMTNPSLVNAYTWMKEIKSRKKFGLFYIHNNTVIKGLCGCAIIRSNNHNVFMVKAFLQIYIWIQHTAFEVRGIGILQRAELLIIGYLSNVNLLAIQILWI